MKTIKGFDGDLKCRDFQYEIGKTYTLPKGENPELCERGFHAISNSVSPLSVFGYYPPCFNGKPSRYCEVEVDGEVDQKQDKVACSRITIGAEIGIKGLINAHIEWVKKHITNEHNAKKGKAATAGSYGAATAGSYGAATAGYRGAATAGDSGAATAGDSGAATAGYSGAATAGSYGAATAGSYGAATAGSYGAATAGYRGAATAGSYGAATSRGHSAVGKNGLAVARGNGVMVKGGIGAILVIAEENENENDYNVKEWKAVVVDGETIKPDTWYKLVNGELIEVKDHE